MGLFDDLKRQAQSFINGSVNAAVNSAAQNMPATAPKSAQVKAVTLSALPQNAAQMREAPEFSQTDPFSVAAFAVAAFARYAASREDGKEMINFLKGPEPLTPREIQFINDRFMDGKDYILRSYLGGTSPDNSYTPAVPYTVEITEYANSRENAGYVRLYLKSSGADSPRPLTFRQKPSTGEWFLWEFEGILAGIRTPKAEDKWA
ncbi:MAG: hypothetical protein J6T73_01590 [Clostridia bacterium]|nr:hypothetical protein [Clostridia bacterium]